jgi:hypothetical protein
LSEEPVPGVRVGRAGDRAVPLLPCRAPCAGCGPPGTGLQAGKEALLTCRFSERRASLGVLPSASFLS